MIDLAQLSKRERQIIDVIYAHGEATITQVLSEMPEPPTRGALRTLLRDHGTERASGPPPGWPENRLPADGAAWPGCPIGSRPSARRVLRQARWKKRCRPI